MIWIAVASALEPEVGVQVFGGVGNSEQVPVLFGGEATFAIDPQRRLHLELAAAAGPTVDGTFWLGAGPRVRWYAGAPEHAVLSLFAGGGLALDDGPRGLIDGGAAFDLAKSNGPRPRLQATYAWSPGASQRLLIGAGVVFGRQRPVVPPPPEIEPTPEPPAQLTLMEEGMVWLPGPVCQWLLPDVATSELQRLGVQLASMNVLSERTLRDPDGTAGLAPAKAERSPGKVVVVASMSDRVTIGDAEVAVEDGIAVRAHPEGRVDVKVVGGGRVEEWPLGIVPGSAVWLTVDTPQSRRVTFPVNESTLSAETLGTLGTFAENAGDWSFRVRGSFSPEGTEAKNKALADERAEAVRRALIAAGIDGEHVFTAESAPPAEGLAPEEQRAAVITPVENR